VQTPQCARDEFDIVVTLKARRLPDCAFDIVGQQRLLVVVQDLVGQPCACRDRLDTRLGRTRVIGRTAHRVVQLEYGPAAVFFNQPGLVGQATTELRDRRALPTGHPGKNTLRRTQTVHAACSRIDLDQLTMPNGIMTTYNTNNIEVSSRSRAQ